jgi:hypothetical protein
MRHLSNVVAEIDARQQTIDGHYYEGLVPILRNGVMEGVIWMQDTQRGLDGIVTRVNDINKTNQVVHTPLRPDRQILIGSRLEDKTVLREIGKLLAAPVTDARFEKAKGVISTAFGVDRHNPMGILGVGAPQELRLSDDDETPQAQ